MMKGEEQDEGGDADGDMENDTKEERVSQH
jgi:hypothetical protein